MLRLISTKPVLVKPKAYPVLSSLGSSPSRRDFEELPGLRLALLASPKGVGRCDGKRVPMRPGLELRSRSGLMRSKTRGVCRSARGSGFGEPMLGEKKRAQTERRTNNGVA